MAAAEPVMRSATMSSCGLYRYRLTRTWDESYLPLTFCMLNPSTADAEQDDPTIRRCIGFAKREGAGGLVVVNLYALRATDPSVMLRHADPRGPDNWSALAGAACDAARYRKPLVCAFGSRARELDWYEAVEGMRHIVGARLVCLGKTAGGAPRHPLYVRADAPLVPFK